MWQCEDGTGQCWKWLQPWRLMNLLTWAFRMHIASVGVSKFCFLFSLVFCGLLLLLLPALQPPARMMDLPQPRPQVRPAQTGAPLVSRSTGEAYPATWLNTSSARQASKVTRNDNPKSFMHSKDGAYLGENGSGLPGSRSNLLKLKDIFIAVKTTRKYHKSRLELLIQTWISKAKEQVRGAAFYVAFFIA